MEVAAGTHLLSNGVSNWYMVEEGGKITIVDAGTPRDWAVLVQALSGLGRTLADVDAVILTHAHSDHTGFAERARREAPALVHVHRADEAVARGGKPAKHERGIGSHLLHAELYRTVFGLMRRGGVRIIPIAEVSTFEDGALLDVPGRPRALHTPGHTPGNSAVWFEDRSVLCTGDTLVTRNPLTGRVGPQIMPTAFNSDTTQAMGSLDILARAPADTLLPGHGKPWTDGTAAAVSTARSAGPS